MSFGGFTPYLQLGSYSRRKQVLTYSVLVENKFGLFGRVRADNAIDFTLGTFQVFSSPPKNKFLKGVDIVIHKDPKCTLF